MLKKLVIVFVFLAIQIFAESLKLNLLDEKTLSDLGVKMVDISSIAYGNIENSKVKSTIILGKTILTNTNNNLVVYDPWDEAYARMNQRKPTKIVLNKKIKYCLIILTDNHVNILVEDKSKDNLISHYPFKIKIEKVNTKETYYPKDKNMWTNFLIRTPDNDGYKCYLYWNGKKYVYVWVATDDIDQG